LALLAWAFRRLLSKTALADLGTRKFYLTLMSAQAAQDPVTAAWQRRSGEVGSYRPRPASSPPWPEARGSTQAAPLRKRPL
jgi:hypothetical protein